MNRKLFAGLAVLSLLFVGSTVSAQNPDYVLNLPANTTVGSPDSGVNVQATLDNLGMDMAGWSFGVCNDPAFATPTGVNDEGSATVNGGAPAGFLNSATFPEGWTQGVVIDLFGVNVLAGGTSGFVMGSADYDIAGGQTGTSPIQYCETLGTPPVATVVVVGGASIVPTQNDGEFLVLSCDPPAEFEYGAPSVQVFGESPFTVCFSIAETTAAPPAGCPPFPGYETQGFSMGNQCDPTLCNPVAVSVTGPVAALSGGSGPDFATPAVFPDGWTIGCVYSLAGPVETIIYGPGSEVICVDYQTVPGALQGPGDFESPLSWTDGLGIPPVAGVVVVGGASINANYSDGSVSFVRGEIIFIRGDTNADAQVNIADGIWLLNDLFQGGPTTIDVCPAGNDANGDGGIDASDAVYIFNFQFFGGPPPPAPYPDCGLFPGWSPEDCVASACP